MDNNLKPTTVRELLGQHFYIPYYQRGYRWTKKQVKELLDDIWDFAKLPRKEEGSFYCLQPVVVIPKIWVENETEVTGYEVIDGQQRLTTIYIILDYLMKEHIKAQSLRSFFGKEIFTLRYETRKGSDNFLKNITHSNENIDFYHMWEAYRTVKDWFTNEENEIDFNDKNRFLDTLLGKRDVAYSVQFIWYEILGEQSDEENIRLFNRLNIGKIPLTNAELVKALFLSEKSFTGLEQDVILSRKNQIAHLWDEIEQSLNDVGFWSFITNKKQEDFSTKIELLLDINAGKKKNHKDPLFTFLYFLNESKKPDVKLWDLWIDIEKCFLMLKQWHSDRNLYHRIGYLIAVGEPIEDLVSLSYKSRKDIFEKKINEKIAGHINDNYTDLKYDKKSKEIEKILLLFNVETTRQSDNVNEFYPFRFHKGIQWSLEHIHAQNSEGFSKTDSKPWLEWIKFHKEVLIDMLETESNGDRKKLMLGLITELEDNSGEKLSWMTFEQLYRKTVSFFTLSEENKQQFDIHSISNLALLGRDDNSALNNSVFEVKRRELIRLDKTGNYIPVCTKRVFFKYYNDKTFTAQNYFWSSDDQKHYLAEIENKIRPYLLLKNKDNGN